MPQANQIIQSKVPHFVTLFTKLTDSCGSVTSACTYSGLASKAYYAMKNDDFLTAENARKIITAYKRSTANAGRS